LARLDAFFIALMNNPDDRGFIQISVGENDTIEQIKKHIQKLIRHVKYRKFPAERLIFAIEKIEKLESSTTRLLRLPRDVELPCDKCEIINGKDF
jgi:hypothetical protein